MFCTLAPFILETIALTKSIEDQYRILNDIEHVICRPSTYVGSTSNHNQPSYILDHGKFVERECRWNPALLKLFDEIILNAVDESKRNPDLNKIDVIVDQLTGSITVADNGGIPVVKHKETGMYVPEMIFGHLRAGSNFEDDGRTGAGMNGLGSKLTSIFSTEFRVETSDGKKKFIQTFKNNLSEKTAPFTKRSKDSGTVITYTPDYDRLKCHINDDDNHAKLIKRVYDVAGCNPHLKISLNGELIQIKSFEEYVRLYGASTVQMRSPDWEVIVAGSNDGFKHCTFVNNIDTYNGGSHVDYVTDQITARLREHIKKKHKIDVRPSQIRQHLHVFVNCTVEAPFFDSQTKARMTSEPKDYGTEFKVTDRFINKIIGSDVVQSILDWAAAKQKQEDLKELRKLNKDTGKTNAWKKIVKFDDATGTDQCVLILTEGDSAAKTILSARDPKKHGVFPLKGKPLNVRDIPVKKLLANEEIKNIMTILGLEVGVKPDNLRFEYCVVANDADNDGHHILGLVLNLFNEYWPSLLERGFVRTLRTPIIRATYGKTVREFFTQEEFEAWYKPGSKYKIKYIKGLGGHNTKDFKKYLNDPQYTVALLKAGDEDQAALDLVFDKKRADDRKDWLSYGMQGAVYIPDTKDPKRFISAFINSEFKAFSNADNVRSVPSIVDGLKESQRKCVYAMLRHGTNEIKVSQLSAYTALYSAYHHGEMSLNGTIVGLAQDYMGSNNINLFEPVGQFGSILSPAASSPRYIFTKPSEHLRKVIVKEDDCVLVPQYEEGAQKEPVNYYPVLPLWLVNGALGIGSGYASKIMNRSPEKVKKAIQQYLKDGKYDTELLHPEYPGFKGKIKKLPEPNRYSNTGCVTKVNTTTLKVTELPVGYDVDKYKAILIKMIEDGVIKDYDNNSNEDGFEFVIHAARSFVSKSETTLTRILKLSTTVTENITLWDTTGNLRQYEDVHEAFVDWINYRLTICEEWRTTYIDILAEQIDRNRELVAFINWWHNNDTKHLTQKELLVIIPRELGVSVDRATELLSRRISTLSKSGIEKYETEYNDLCSERNVLIESDDRQIMKQRLKGL